MWEVSLAHAVMPLTLMIPNQLFAGKEAHNEGSKNDIVTSEDFMERPSSAKLDDMVWGLMRSCWSQSRPGIGFIRERLTDWTTEEPST